MPGRAGAAVGGGGAQHTPLRCPGLCRTSPRGESSLSGQPPVLVASACLGLSGLRPLSSVSALCFPRPPPGSQSLISLLSPHRRVRPCPAPAAWCPCFSSRRGAPGAGRPRASQCRRTRGDVGAPGSRGPLGCVRAQAVAGCAASLCAALQRLRPTVPCSPGRSPASPSLLQPQRSGPCRTPSDSHHRGVAQPRAGGGPGSLQSASLPV